MAIGAFNVAARIDRIFSGIVDSGSAEDWVSAELIEVGLNVFGSDRTRVTGKAIHLFIGKIE
jgi:hypothetical protein